MDNPFSAPRPKTAPVRKKEVYLPAPPPLEDLLPIEEDSESLLPPIKTLPVESIAIPLAEEGDLPPIQDRRPELKEVCKTESLTEVELITQPVIEPEPEDELETPEVAVIPISEPGVESKFDLEEETVSARPSVSVNEPLVVAEEVDQVVSEEMDQAPEEEITPTPRPVMVHHQPTITADPQGWSDADFAGHDSTELPALSMEEKSCRMCKYFHFNDSHERSNVRFGECRRQAPTGVGKAVWPSVLWESWCGEWEIGVGQAEIMQMVRSIAEEAAESLELGDLQD